MNRSIKRLLLSNTAAITDLDAFTNDGDDDDDKDHELPHQGAGAFPLEVSEPVQTASLVLSLSSWLGERRLARAR